MRILFKLEHNTVKFSLNKHVNLNFNFEWCNSRTVSSNQTCFEGHPIIVVRVHDQDLIVEGRTTTLRHLSPHEEAKFRTKLFCVVSRRKNI